MTDLKAMTLQDFKAYNRHFKYEMEILKIIRSFKCRWWRLKKMKFELVEINKFKKLSKNGKWFYDYPKNSLIFEYDRELEIIQQIPKASWQRRKADSGEDISKYLITLDKLAVRDKKQKELKRDMLDWFNDHKKHKKVALIFTR